ncbi:uncharacterized protein LOC125495441 [Beta vulgaris subsp. vulgaris]|uniref:uncharacterized protein LOC125495441 n=1 Tax=Beta vulgaris subsp. vulgaris TaxID=3555 RepID=UPI0020366A55|nr:uncharacterized protein LOC125495441 [Beta vulgaris subsp. vulgaris]
MVEPVGLTGGILILWNSGVISFTTIRKELRAIHGIIQVSSNNIKFAITAIYASTLHNSRLELWKIIENISNSIDLPWLCIGDFNEITSHSEKWGGRNPKQNRMLAYSEAMDNCNLIDLGFKGPRFTWFNKRKRNPIFERLDRAWVNSLWLNTFPESTIHHLQRLSSDHNPILLNTKTEIHMPRNYKKPFKFETMWLSEPGFDDLIKHNWPIDQSEFHVKLKNISFLMNSWAKQNHGNVFKRKKNLIARIQGIQRAIDHDPRKAYLIDLENKLKEDLDEDTKFQPIMIDPSNAPTFPPPLRLKMPFSAYGGTKAPGRDGIHAIFLQTFWDTIGNDCTKMIVSVFRTGKIPNDLNRTVVALIPKSENPEKISQFRPISLVNTSLKVISKILVKRMRPILSKEISPNQNSFISGRGTDVNLIIASEILHSMGKKKGKKGTFAMKIDLEKAYDRLEWDFIRTSLLAIGFDEKTTNLCMECITTTTTSILINGRPSREFTPSRGIRQGDPLSPYIFIICMEMLSKLIHKSCEDNKWKPFVIRGGTSKISHLMFADDLILFGEATPQTLSAVNDTLRDFFSISGQKMNTSKSKIYFSPNTSQDIRDEFEQDLDVLSAKDLGNYLGFPLSNKRPSKNHLLPIVEKISKKLALWKSNCLSKAGRALLISTTFQSIPRYFMQGILFPKTLTTKMDSNSANFLWGNRGNKKGINWIAWEHVCKPKELGGLGFRTNEDLNKLGLVKQCWNLDNQKNWAAHFMADKYIRKNKGPLSFKKGSYLWKNIGKGWDIYKESLCWNPGTGESINFWLDKWMGNTTLREHFTGPLSDIEEKKSLAEVLSHNVEENLPSNLPQNLINLAKSIKLNEEQDLLYSSWSSEGKFNNKEAASYIQSLKPNHPKSQFDWSIIWNAPGHPKIKLFLWQAWWERLPTNENLFFRKCANSPECNTCFNSKENILHILRDCPRADSIWNKINKPNWPLNQNLYIWIEENLKLSTFRFGKIPWNVLFSFTVWEIWKRRNNWIFKRKNDNEDVFIKSLTWFAQEWYFSQPNTNLQKKLLSPHNTKWKPPEPNKKKINVDASFLVTNHVTGIGGLCRDSSGGWIKGFKAKCFCKNSKVAEIQAILLGLQWAREEAWTNFIIASDCSKAVTDINSREERKDDLTRMVKMCRILLDQDGGQLLHERREANSPADELAKRAREDTRCSFEFECILDPPPDCYKLILLDYYSGTNLNDPSSFVVNST